MCKRRLVTVALAGAVWAALTGHAGAAGSQAYTDVGGDAGSGPDITNVVVSNDDAGRIRFKIETPNVPGLQAQFFAAVELNTDSDPATGNPELGGSDYQLATDGSNVIVGRWEGTNLVRVPTPASLSVSYAGGPTISVNRADVGNVQTFLFEVATWFWNAEGTGIAEGTFDVAPNVDYWRYTLVLGPPKLSLVSPRLVPVKPLAGKTFTAGMRVKDDTNGVPAAGGTVTCAFTVAGKPVRMRRAVTADGSVTCTGKLPKTAKGKTLRGTITYTYKGATVKRTFKAKVA